IAVIEIDGLTIVAQRPIIGPAAGQCVGALKVGRRMRRVQPDRLAVVRDGLFVFIDLVPQISAAGVGQRILGIEPDRLAVVGHRTIAVSPLAPDVAAIVEGVGITRGELDRLLVVEQCPIVLLSLGPDFTAIIVGPGIVRVERDRLVVIRHAEVVVLLLEPEIAAIVVGIVRIRQQPYRLVVVEQGAVVVALGEQGDAAVIVGDRQGGTWLAAGIDDGRAAGDLLIERLAVLVLAQEPVRRPLSIRRRTTQKQPGARNGGKDGDQGGDTAHRRGARYPRPSAVSTVPQTKWKSLAVRVEATTFFSTTVSEPWVMVTVP